MNFRASQVVACLGRLAVRRAAHGQVAVTAGPQKLDGIVRIAFQPFQNMIGVDSSSRQESLSLPTCSKNLSAFLANEKQRIIDLVSSPRHATVTKNPPKKPTLVFRCFAKLVSRLVPSGFIIAVYSRLLTFILSKKSHSTFSLAGYSSFAGKLAGYRLIFAGSVCYFTEAKIGTVLRYLSQSKLKDGETFWQGKLSITMRGNDLVVENHETRKVQAQIEALRDYIAVKKEGIIGAFKQGLPAAVGTDSVAQRISLLGEEVMAKACALAQAIVEERTGHREDDFSIALAGSIVFGPHLGSDIDFLLLHRGKSAYYEMLADEIVAVVADCGWEAHNVVDGFGLGKTIDTTDLRKQGDSFKNNKYLFRVVSDLRCLSGVGNDCSFAAFVEINKNLPLLSSSQSLSRWLLEYAYSDDYLRSRPPEELANVSEYLLPKFKFYFSLGRMHWQVSVRCQSDFFQRLSARGVIHASEAHSLLMAYEFFTRLHNSLLLNNYKSLNKDSFSSMVALLGYKSADDFLYDFINYCQIIEGQLERLKGECGHDEAEIKRAISIYNILTAIQKFCWRLMCGDVRVIHLDKAHY